MAGRRSIVLLNEADSARAAMLHAACFDVGSEWSARSMRETLNAQTTLALGLEDGDHLTGLLLIQRVPPDAEILTICVHPDRRRSGAAISFYERNGFGRDGVRKNYYRREGGGAVDAVLMSRPLAGHTHKSGA